MCKQYVVLEREQEKKKPKTQKTKLKNEKHKTEMGRMGDKEEVYF